MTPFWIFAAALSAGALLILVLPLWSERRRQGRWSVSALTAACLTIPLAFIIYSQVTTYDATAVSPEAEQEIAAVRRLAKRLEAQPDDVEGWQLLGRSYIVLGEYDRAQEAFLEAWSRTSAPSTELKLGLGEALIWSEPTAITGRGGDLIEDVLEAEPTNQRALWWGGLVAAERGRVDAARQRWTTLLDFDPPADVAALIRQQLARLPGESSGPSGPNATAAGPVLTLEVSIADGMPVDSLGPNSNLFIFARAPGGGPPIAGTRHPLDSLPGVFELSDADAIIAGRSLAAFPELTIIARISVSGDPVEQPGDLFAEATVRPGDSAPIQLSIDRIVGGDEPPP